MRICAFICSASTPYTECSSAALCLGKSVKRACGQHWTSLPPWTRLQRILACSMTENQGQNNRGRVVDMDFDGKVCHDRLLLQREPLWYLLPSGVSMVRAIT